MQPSNLNLECDLQAGEKDTDTSASTCPPEPVLGWGPGLGMAVRWPGRRCRTAGWESWRHGERKEVDLTVLPSSGEEVLFVGPQGLLYRALAPCGAGWLSLGLRFLPPHPACYQQTMGRKPGSPAI